MKINEAKQRRTRELDMALSECILHAQKTNGVRLSEVIVVLTDILRRYAEHNNRAFELLKGVRNNA